MDAEIVFIGIAAVLLLFAKLTDDVVLIPSIKSTDYKTRTAQGYGDLDNLKRPHNPLMEEVNKSSGRGRLEYDRTIQPYNQPTEYIDPVSDTRSRAWVGEKYDPSTKDNKIFSSRM